MCWDRGVVFVGFTYPVGKAYWLDMFGNLYFVPWDFGGLYLVFSFKNGAFFGLADSYEFAA